MWDSLTPSAQTTPEDEDKKVHTKKLKQQGSQLSALKAELAALESR